MMTALLLYAYSQGVYSSRRIARACESAGREPMPFSVMGPVITGRDDHFAPPDKAAVVQGRVAGARLAVVEDAGHMLTSEQPEAFNRVLGEFVQALPR